MKKYLIFILSKLKFFVLILIQKWYNFWGNESGAIMHQSGELIVTGSGEVEIELKKNPSSVKVFFDDDIIVVPCNPHHHDHLHWHVKNLHHHHQHDSRHDHCNHNDHYILVISWKVHNVREIKWSVHY